MAPAAVLERIPQRRFSDSDDDDHHHEEVGLSLLDMASAEIERMRLKSSDMRCPSFPPACAVLLRSIEGNSRCVDCGELSPEWASVSFGVLLCLKCSGRHRSYGVQVSCVRSINMDEWSVQEVIAMLEGGNNQLEGFFARHALSVHTCSPTTCEKTTITPQNVVRLRYKTKAAQFYRQHMNMHAVKVLKAGVYRGREISRRLHHGRVERCNSSVE